MKVMKKYLSLLLVIMLCVGYSHCYADIPSDSLGSISPNSGLDSESIVSNDIAPKIWNSAKLVLQVASLSTILFIGVKYMMASADQRADIKKSSIGLVIGIIIVFGTTILIDFVTIVAGELMNV